MRLNMLTRTFAFFATIGIALAQAPDGRLAFQNRCAGCHGTDGNGGEHGPSILARIQARNDQELTTVIREGVPQRGMPAFNDMPAAEIGPLVSFLRTLIRPAGGRGGRGVPARVKINLTDGKTLEGAAIGRTGREMQLRTDDQRIHLLRK